MAAILNGQPAGSAPAMDIDILTPNSEEKGLFIDLHGSLEGIFSMATASDRAKVEEQLKMRLIWMIQIPTKTLKPLLIKT